MKIVKYKIALLSLALLVSGGLLAQHKHELSVWGAGGLSTLKYKTSFGKQKDGTGGAFGLGYTLFFSDNWGVGTGAELSFYNAKAKLGGLKDNYWIKDVLMNEDARLYLDVNKYTEKQEMISVNIPLMLQYQTSGHHRFYAAVGGKIGFPISEKFKVSGATYDVSAYYPSTNQTLFDPMYPAGYGTHTGVGAKGDLDFKIAYILSAEAGMKWRLADNLALYTGAYFDYGLNDIDKNDKVSKILEYNREIPVSINSNSLLQSRDTDGDVYVNKVRPMAIGVKVKLAFGLGEVNAPADIVVIPSIPQISNAEQEARRVAKEAEAAAKKAAAEAARLAELERLRKEKEALELAAKKKAELEQAKLDVAFTLNNFQLGKAAITPEIKAILDRSIGVLRAHPELKIYSTGYTCDKGTTDINMKVSMQRAQTIRDYMIKEGIDSDRIVIRAEGENNPAYPNTNEANRKLNRRVEVVAHE